MAAKGNAGGLLPDLLPAEVAAGLLGITSRMLRKLAVEGFVERTDRGQYPPKSAVQGYVRWIKDEERRGTKAQAENGLRSARQREVELRIARTEGKLVEIEAVYDVMSDIFSTLRAELNGVPASVTRDLRLRGEIEKAHNVAFARSQSKFREASEALRAGHDPIGDGA